MATKKMRIHKGDKVKVISGRYEDKDKVSTVLRAMPETNRVVVEKVHMVKKHMRPTQQNTAGGIIEMEAPIHVSNVMLVCPHCEKPTRIGMTFKEVDGKQRKFRTCKRCGKLIDE